MHGGEVGPAAWRARLGAFFLPEAPAPGTPSYLGARFIVLRALGLLYLAIFVALAFQIRGLIGPAGILPARELLANVAEATPGLSRLWEVPSLLWIRADDLALDALVVVGTAASLLLTMNVAPRAALLACGVTFLSFAAAAQVFSEYQSDTMILEATAIGVVLAPSGLRPGLGAGEPPTRAALFLLRWEWFRIYFESGLVKLGSGDPTWRDFTAMDHYYENGPLPTWIGWYAQQLPHAVHAATVALTLITELFVVWLAFFPRRFKLLCFAVVTTLQAGIILTANYAFLNYLVLVLGVLLVDDEALAAWGARARRWARRPQRPERRLAVASPVGNRRPISALAGALWLAWIFYASIAGLAFEYAPPGIAWLGAPARALAPLRVAGRYGLFAVMTPARYEIELQGSRDGRVFVPYPFRFKPQDLHEAPGIYAPYQPRFEWNLWFASLGSWRDNTWVLRTEACLLRGSPDVLALFRRDPFDGRPPRFVRAVVSQYWMTDRATLRRDGAYWRRDTIGLYGPELTREEDGSVRIVDAPAPTNR